MTPWTRTHATHDTSDQHAQAADDALDELYAGRDDWDCDNGPTRAEADRDEYGWDL